MTLEAQRIAIAEACGWKRVEVYSWTGSVRDPKQWNEVRDLPNYLNDLNAMHEAEKVLNDEQDLDYSESLERVVGGRFNSNNAYDMNLLRSATAPQRAEAFLKTIGKWEDSK